MGDLSEHFSRWEFDQHDGNGRATPSPVLIQRLELLRAMVGQPLVIVSGYRSPVYNHQVGGVPKSQHQFNRAADIPAGYATIDQAKHAGFTGIGYKGKWAVHVDVRPGPVVSFPD